MGEGTALCDAAENTHGQQLVHPWIVLLLETKCKDWAMVSNNHACRSRSGHQKTLVID
jgi:hypothetical protein